MTFEASWHCCEVFPNLLIYKKAIHNNLFLTKKKILPLQFGGPEIPKFR